MIKLSVAVGRSADARTWQNKKFTWDAFADRLYDVHRTPERYGEYMSMSKTEQSRVKDIGGYVCGYLNGGRRGKSDIMYRSALTLDLDFAPIDMWDTFTLLWDCAAVLHSTHKHSTNNPRFRLVVPLDRDVTPDEYVAIARKFAASINIEYFDPTTFDTNRLMFWPSASSDAEWVYEEQEGEPLNADKVLASYRNWKDISEWAFSRTVADKVHKERGKKQADPLAKNNIVGYFCGAYDIHQAIEEFLPDVYEPAGEDRYTFLQGSTACGLVTYDGKFAYSHHGTDPASGELCNAFDLVRIHKFGSADTEGSATKSYALMRTFCKTLPPVKMELARAMVSDARSKFECYTGGGDTYADDADDDPAPANAAGDAKRRPDGPPVWMGLMDVDKFDKYENSAYNVGLIIQNDPRLADRFRLDLFSGKRYVAAPVPWVVRCDKYPRQLIDEDYSGLRKYIEDNYKITTPSKIDDVLSLELQRNAYHPVRDYLDGLEWDGVKRIDTLLIECFNAVDNAYIREASRKWLVAAVARVMQPGIKFDNVLLLIGEEGTRKSSYFRKLGGEWFTDSITTVQGKEAFEQLIGKWIAEMAEMAAADKAETIQTKHYLSKQGDSFRAAYHRETKDHLRQCVFGATSNNRTPLRDADGNRRFWPVDVRLKAKTAGRLDPMSKAFEDIRDQIWAEAVEAYRLGETLVLSDEAEAIADVERAGRVEVDARRGMVEDYLDTDVPDAWRDMTIEIRREYLDTPGAYKGKGGLYKRRYICVAEIWCECFGKRKEDLDQRKSREITAIMRTVPGWEYASKTRRFRHYGVQRYYEYIDNDLK